MTPSTRVFDHIPRLREVLAHGGWPGAIYAQVMIHNLKAAKERTQRPAHLDELHGGAIYYTIVGPAGRADVALVGTGEVIPGASPDSGNRLFFTDGEVGIRTGLPVQYPIWLGPEPQEEQPDESRRRQVEKPARENGVRAEAREAARKAPKAPRAITEKEIARRKAASERMKAMHAKRRVQED